MHNAHVLVRCVLFWVSVLWMASPSNATASTVAANPDNQSLIFIMLDGFRWDLVDPAATPNLDRLAKGGVRGEMIPVWPTISSPNHWALVTGLYPIHSGVFHNDMYDPANGGNFKNTGDWGHGEPIWTAVTHQGGISGVVGGWAGAQNASNANTRPSFYIPYSAVIGERDNRAELVLQILDQDSATRPDLLALYVIEVDHDEHRYGVGSAEANKPIKRIDRMIGKLVAGLAVRHLNDKVNIVIVADHGMMNVGQDQLIYLDDYVDLTKLMVPPVGSGPVFSLWPKPGMEDTIHERLRSAHLHLHAFRPNEIPARLNCCHPDRTPPILLSVDLGWIALLRTGEGATMKGMHGYDNMVSEMYALFIAAGPAIRAAPRSNPSTMSTSIH